MTQGDYVLISASYLARTEGYTTKGGKKKWYRVRVSKVNSKSFEFSGEDMKYIHEIPFNKKDLYKEITQKRGLIDNMNADKVEQPYKDIREHLKDSNFNNVVMEAFELMCGETVEMDLQFDNYPMAHTKYRETEASKKSIEFSEKYHGTSVVVKLALEQREELLKELKKLKENYAKLEINCANKLQDNDLIVHIAVDDLRECQNANKKLLEENQKLNQKPQFPNTNLWDIQELTELREFAKIVSKDIVISHNTTMSDDITYGCNFYDEILHKDKFNLIKKVVEKYGE